jgi:hypothetical protein
LNRQAERYAWEGVALSLSTLACNQRHEPFCTMCLHDGSEQDFDTT